MYQPPMPSLSLKPTDKAACANYDSIAKLAEDRIARELYSKD
jgi:hypothetical protein